MKAHAAVGPLIILGALAAACGSGRRSEPLIGPVALTTEEQRRGEGVFFLWCHKCHPNGDSGLGPAINNKALPQAAIELQVRTGVGAMPAFDDEQISGKDLDALVAYLKTLRKAE